MLSRAVLGVGGMAAAPVVLSTVYAAEGNDQASKEASVKTLVNAPAKPKKIKPSQLPIYGEPTPAELEFIPEEIGSLRKNVSVARQGVWSTASQFQGTIDSVKSGYNTTKQYTTDMLTYVQQDTQVLHRAGIITLAGFGGVVAGYRGGFVRKTTFAALGMTTAAALCYPNQAVDITKRGWEQARDHATDLWKQQKKEEAKPKKDVSVSKKVGDELKKGIEEVGKSEKKIDESKMDFGQSKPEDKDMYTTRGS